MITLNSILLSVAFATLSGPTVYLKLDPKTQIDPQILQEEVAARLGEYSVSLNAPSTGSTFTVTINLEGSTPNAVIVEITAGAQSVLKRSTSLPTESIPAARQLAVIVEGPIRRASKSLKEMVPKAEPKPKTAPKAPTAVKPSPKKETKPGPLPAKSESPPANDQKSPVAPEPKNTETQPPEPDIQSEAPPLKPPAPHFAEFDFALGLGYLPESQTSFPIIGLGAHRQWLPHLGTGLEMDFAINTSRGVSSLPLTSYEMGAALLLSSSLRFTGIHLRAALGPLLILDFVSPENSFSFSSSAQILLMGSRGYVESRMPLMDFPFEWILRLEGDFLPKSPRYTWRGAPVESRGPLRLSAHLGISFPIME